VPSPDFGDVECEIVPANVKTNMKTNRALKKSPASVQGAKQVRFSLPCGDAEMVYLAGTFNGWDPQATPLHREGEHHWTCELALSPGAHEYQFVVDGRWLPDPQAAESTRTPFGTVNSIVRVSAERA